MTKLLSLGFHYHIPAVVSDSNIVMPGYQGCFIDSLASVCERLVCFLYSPSKRDNFVGDYVIQSRNVELVNIGPHASVPYRLLRANKYTQCVRKYANDLDAILIRGPSPLLPAIANAANQLPVALLLVGDYLNGINDLPQPAWRKELIRLWARYNYNEQIRVARNSLTFVNSQVLHKQLEGNIPNLIETRTTTLTESDFFTREDTCQNPPYHLLYTGRLDRAKGLLEMVQALALLTEDGHQFILDLVGHAEKKDPIITDIKKKALELGVSDRIIFHGYKPLGPELFEYYRKSDIYVIASKASEGFPRTIWEAMANSLPVIATKVGSIPAFISTAAELIEPRNPKVLASAITKISTNDEIRRNMIKEGRKLAQENTLEKRATEIVTGISKYVLTRKIKQ